jgi:hypothetical protein
MSSVYKILMERYPMKRERMIVFGVIAALIALVSPVHAGLVENMVALDRVYIPALVLTNQPDRPATVIGDSVKRLGEGWQEFVSALSDSDRSNPSLAAAIKDIGPGIEKSLKLADAGKRRESHEALEVVRISLWKVRGEMGIAYLPDLLTAFHEPMEAFVDLALKLGADAAKVKSLLEECREQWTAVEKAKLDPALFRLSPEKTAKYNEMVKKVRGTLGTLSATLAAGDKDGFITALKTVKSNFSQTYMVFGDFSGLI